MVKKSFNTLGTEKNGCHFADDIFSHTFPGKERLVFWFNFHCSWFQKNELSICQHCFRPLLDVKQATSYHPNKYWGPVNTRDLQWHWVATLASRNPYLCDRRLSSGQVWGETELIWITIDMLIFHTLCKQSHWPLMALRLFVLSHKNIYHHRIVT